MDARHDIAYLLILALVAAAILGVLLHRRARRRERRRANAPIRLTGQSREAGSE